MKKIGMKKKNVFALVMSASLAVFAMFGGVVFASEDPAVDPIALDSVDPVVAESVVTTSETMTPTMSTISSFLASEQSLSLMAPLGSNLYGAAQTVSLSQAVAGDAFVAGSEIYVNAPLGGDLFGGAANIFVNEAVAGDVRAGGANVFISKDVGGDLIVFGSNIKVAPGVKIGGDAVLYGANIQVDGDVAGSIMVGGAVVGLNGKVAGNAKVEFEEVTIGSGAAIAGSLTYKAPKKQENLEAIAGEGATYQKLVGTQSSFGEKEFAKTFLGILTGFMLYWWAFLSLFATILVFVFRKFFVGVATTLREKPRKSLLAGFLLYFGTPFVILVLSLTFLGLPIAGVLGLLYIIIWVLGSMASTAVLASWFIEKVRGGLKKAAWRKIILTVVVIALLFVLISGIDLIAVFFAMGALLLHKGALAKKMLAEEE